jgi:type II secretory pathway pseudopilin PulG
MEINRRQRRRGFTHAMAGFTLIEMLIYIALLVVIFLLVINTVMSFTRSYRELSALRAADQGGSDALERIVREIRDATGVDTTQSVLGTTTGTLFLVNNATTTKFYLQNNTVHLTVNGTYVGPLTGSSTSVTSLIFYFLSTTTTEAVKIDMTVQGKSGQTTKTKNFHTTTVLRSS